MTSKPKLVQDDPWLEPYADIISKRYNAAYRKEEKLLSASTNLSDFATGYLYYGVHKTTEGWVVREWAPNATSIHLVGECNNWKEDARYEFRPLGQGNWELQLASIDLQHQQQFRLLIRWNGGQGERLPSYIRRCLQHPDTKAYNAQVWAPPHAYQWKYPSVSKHKTPLIYEAHVGMATEDERVGSYDEFRTRILPRIKDAGYNTVQLMAIQEHPYYGSFGYHVSNFFAVSSRFGTPDELKALIDEAHSMGLAVIMDLVHSHAVKNIVEGLGLFDGDPHQYFQAGSRREHIAWDSLCFDYGKEQVLHFLLSNCKYWLEEYQFDGFRFDGVTSMLYFDHGLARDFTSYEFYYDGGQDGDAITYLTLANKLIHQVKPAAISIAEEMSGMPGLAEPIENGGIGFDYRMAMGTPDYWIKIIKERTDDSWDMAEMFHELTSKRYGEKTVSYAESHDQALVGDKTIIFRLLDKEMYFHMNKTSQNLIVERGIALHKMIRLITFATAGGSYLNFMGNEFGHPEWIDFPREGNNWSYKYARRMWSLRDNSDLRYHFLSDFDKSMLELQNSEEFLDNTTCESVALNSSDKILAFHRGDLLFVFNFHPDKSFPDYGLKVHAGKYRIVLNTDESFFGGFDRIDSAQTYFADRLGGVSGENWIKLYLPSRVAIVLKKIPTPSVYSL